MKTALGTHRFQRAWLRSKYLSANPGTLEAMRTQGFSEESFTSGRRRPEKMKTALGTHRFQRAWL